MKKKLSRLNIDALKQNYEVLDTELLRSFLGGLDLGGNCAFLSIANARGKTEAEVIATYIGYMKGLNPNASLDYGSWEIYVSAKGVSLDHMSWLTQQFGISHNTGYVNGMGVLVINYGNNSGHAVNITGVDNKGDYLYHDYQNNTSGVISKDSSGITIFW